MAFGQTLHAWFGHPSWAISFVSLRFGLPLLSGVPRLRGKWSFLRLVRQAGPATSFVGSSYLVTWTRWSGSVSPPLGGLSPQSGPASCYYDPMALFSPPRSFWDGFSCSLCGGPSPQRTF